AFLLQCRTMTNIGEIGTGAHIAEHHDRLKDVIPRCTATFAPLTIKIGTAVLRSHLLGVAIETTIRRINPRSVQRHSRGWDGKDMGTFVIVLRIEPSSLW